MRYSLMGAAPPPAPGGPDSGDSDTPPTNGAALHRQPATTYSGSPDGRPRATLEDRLTGSPRATGVRARRAAADQLPGPAGGRAPGRDRGRDPRPPGRDRRRRDRVRQDHPAAQDLPGARPRRRRADRAHPAAPAGGPDRRRPDRRG